MINLASHWDKAYEARSLHDLGWYEEISQPSLELIGECSLDKNACILNVGAGTSTLTDSLLDLDYKNLIVSDISEVALLDLKERLGTKGKTVRFIKDDLSNPKLLTQLNKVDLWHDRAVLHFLTESKDQKTYFKLVQHLVKQGGYVIFGEFEREIGAKKCNNLDVYRYDASMLSSKLGQDFKLLKSFSYNYVNPRKEDRPYIYALFQRK